MIDFRYHLISIVAVLLALSCGVVLGSGVLGGPLLEDVRQRAEDVRRTNEEVRALADDRLQVIDRYQAFAQSSIPYLLEGELEDAEVVFVTTDGTDEGIVDSLTDVVIDAGGEVGGTLRLTDRLLLEDEIAVDQLALAVGSVSSAPEELRSETGRVLGNRLGAGMSSDRAGRRLDNLLETLAGSDFLSINAPRDEDLVSERTAFLILAGGAEEPPFPAATVLTPLARALSGRGASVMVGETAGSIWGILSGVGDEDLRDSVSTAGGIEDLPGQVAAVLGLARSLDGPAVHVGYGDGTDSVLPSPGVEPEATPDP